MSRLTKFSVTTFLSAILLCASAAQAMDIEMFDQLSPLDQQDYLTFLVKNVRTVLIEQAQPEQARKVDGLFKKTPGRHNSVGETQFEETLMVIRTFYREPMPFKFSSIVGQVESVLMEVLVHNGIKIPPRFARSLNESRRVKPFWPKRPLRAS